jgi:hypothetical protein
MSVVIIRCLEAASYISASQLTNSVHITLGKDNALSKNDTKQLLTYSRLGNICDDSSESNVRHICHWCYTKEWTFEISPETFHWLDMK